MAYSNMKKYVILSFSIGNIGGAQIYNRNKMIYAKNLGYEVFIFSLEEAQVYIEDFKKYKELVNADLKISPIITSKKKIKKMTDWFLKKIVYEKDDEVFIESQTTEMALWGEVFAKSSEGKNFCYLLGETFNDVHMSEIRFFEYKRKRGELAFIKDTIMDNLFFRFPQSADYKAVSLPAVCANSVDDIEMPKHLKIDLNRINIAIVGRTSKPYVSKAVYTVVEIARKYNKSQFHIFVIGGGTKVAENELEKIVVNAENVELSITGYMYPIPESMIRKMKLCVAGAGSATAICTYSPTISMDVIKCEALGVLGLDTMDTVVGENASKMNIYDYIEKILFLDFLKGKKFNYPPQTTKERICKVLSTHFEYYKKAIDIKEYYSFEKRYSIREIILKVAYIFGGKRGVMFLKRIK